ncbi:hypothetical protein VE03_03795 [Pseudogymnoascus sp. 23342-1-I1]|nr:hypothetical protein VE03_03795 [Pseudogymnoascus sp. 23342-1-I1]
MDRPLLWQGIAWAYEQLAMYEAAIAAGSPLPEPPGFLIPTACKRSLRSASREQGRAMQYVEMLRNLTRMNDEMTQQCMRAHLELDRAYLAIIGREVRKALGEFGVVGTLKFDRAIAIRDPTAKNLLQQTRPGPRKQPPQRSQAGEATMMDLILYGETGPGRPFPMCYIAREVPDPPKRSLESFCHDESDNNEETAKKKPVRRMKTFDQYITARFERSARKQSLRSFSRSKQAMAEPITSRIFQKQSDVDNLTLREQFKVLEQQTLNMMLSNRRQTVEMDLESLNQWVLQARQNFDIGDCAKAAALSTTLPRTLGEGAVANGPITAE